MPNLKLTLACWDYDRTRPLIDGRVKPEGIDLDVEAAPDLPAHAGQEGV
jgi:4,5-dihydroxyphthalate decarboxylase